MQKIKFLVMDVDGTLTDGKIYIGSEGEVMKAFNIKDGCGIHDILLPIGIIPIIITGRSSKILENRCKELEITHLYQGIKDKITKLDEVLLYISAKERKKYFYSNIAYIGDDINDLPVMKLIKAASGVVGCPVDAIKWVVELADFVSEKTGGNGAVREFIEWLIDNEKHETM